MSEEQLSDMANRRHHIHMMSEGVVLARPHLSGPLIHMMDVLAAKFVDESVDFRDLNYRKNPQRRDGVIILPSHEMGLYTNLQQQPALTVLKKIYSEVPGTRVKLEPEANSFLFKKNEKTGKKYGILGFSDGGEVRLKDEYKKVDISLRGQNYESAPSLPWRKPAITLVVAAPTATEESLEMIVDAVKQELPFRIKLDQLQMLDFHFRPIMASDRLPRAH